MIQLQLSATDKWSRSILSGIVVLSLLLLALVLGVNSIDHILEDLQYVGDGVWLLEKTLHPTFYILFYSLPKAALIGFGVVLIFKAAYHWSRKRRHRAVQYGLSIATLAIVPSGISYLKNISKVPCPYNLIEYGGTEQTQSVLYYLFHRTSEAGGCFPAGHASGGFALIGLIFIARNRREALGVIGLSLIVGFLMGFYQQARGAHFMSHTLATEVISVGFVLLLYRLFYEKSVKLS